MGQMDAVTAMELEAARRREVFSERHTAFRTGPARKPAQDAHVRGGQWLAATATIVGAAARLARG